MIDLMAYRYTVAMLHAYFSAYVGTLKTNFFRFAMLPAYFRRSKSLLHSRTCLVTTGPLVQNWFRSLSWTPSWTSRRDSLRHRYCWLYHHHSICYWQTTFPHRSDVNHTHLTDFIAEGLWIIFHQIERGCQAHIAHGGEGGK